MSEDHDERIPDHAAPRWPVGLSAGGLLRSALRRRMYRTRRGPRFRRRLTFFLFGVGIAVLSIATCSSGVDPASLTAEYGPPVPASRSAAERFLQRSAAAAQAAPNAGTLRIEVTESEATSALSLGLMVPELMRAAEGMRQGEMQGYEDLGALREALRARVDAKRDTLGALGRLFSHLDPQIRSGDVQVRFTGAGEVVVAGDIRAWSFRQPALVVFAPRAADGELELDFRKGRLGRLPAPEFAFDLLGRLVASLLLQAEDYAQIREITVRDGRLTFVATRS